VSAPDIAVWDRPVRWLHWALAAGVGSAWVTSEVWTRFHEPLGYAVLAVAAARLAWGFVGGTRARFRGFVARPAATAAYLAQLVRRREPRFLGHNPLGGWMVVTLLVCVSATALTGWLYTTDRYWGDDGVETLHRLFAWATLALIPLHVGGVILMSARHRENLVASMFSGRKRAPSGDDVA
jgi:cytochrome b